MDQYQALYRLVETDEAAAFKQLGFALNDNPKDPKLVALMAKLFQKGDGYGLAYHLWGLVMRMDQSPEILCASLNNQGLAAACVGSREMQEEGASLMRRALKMKPDNLASLNNLALYELHNGDYKQCMAFCERSLEIDPSQAQVYECRAYARLMLGQWEEGWKDWEHSVGTKYRPNIGKEPYWRGEKGVKLHIRGEQGLGDEISFASCLPDVSKDAFVSLECDKRLEGLFKRSFPNIGVYGTRYHEQERGWYTEHDARCLIGSLPRYYRNKDEDFPGTPYLVADPERRLQWRALLDTLPGKKIGIAWTGGRPSTFSEKRSFALEQWLPILDSKNTFVSLQYKNPQEELDAFKAKHGIEVKHWPRVTGVNDYDETAALVAELDLVICATTALVHLCGALGKECWVLTPRKARWLYQREGRRIPWYKSVELFRETKEKGWPIAEVAERVRGLG